MDKQWTRGKHLFSVDIAAAHSNGERQIGMLLREQAGHLLSFPFLTPRPANDLRPSGGNPRSLLPRPGGHGFVPQAMRLSPLRIFTMAKGEVSELHIGLKGTMGALYLKDLVERTRRVLEGRVNAGRCMGSPAFGYTVVRKMNNVGELDRGLRTIDPERAAVVRRIFEAYATGSSPRKIAQTLNAEGVAAPGGGGWYDASILGRAKRGDGLLRNELYIGRLVWRRRVTAKDPMSGKRLRREAQPDTL